MFSSGKKGETRPPLRQYLMDGEFFIGAALGTTLTKLALRFVALQGADHRKTNRFCAEAMLVMASVLHLGKSGMFVMLSCSLLCFTLKCMFACLPSKAITNDDSDRLWLCLRVLAADRFPVVIGVFEQLIVGRLSQSCFQPRLRKKLLYRR